MKKIIIPILVCIIGAYNQPSSSNQKQNIGEDSKSNSVFKPAENENIDNLKHIKQELVAPPFLPILQLK